MDDMTRHLGANALTLWIQHWIRPLWWTQIWVTKSWFTDDYYFFSASPAVAGFGGRSTEWENSLYELWWKGNKKKTVDWGYSACHELRNHYNYAQSNLVCLITKFTDVFFFFFPPVEKKKENRAFLQLLLCCFHHQQYPEVETKSFCGAVEPFARRLCNTPMHKQGSILTHVNLLCFLLQWQRQLLPKAGHYGNVTVCRLKQQARYSSFRDTN